MEKRRKSCIVHGISQDNGAVEQKQLQEFQWNSIEKKLLVLF